MEEYNFETCIDALRKSSMFHFSLGSKELFHSNFLHWLSETDWHFFVNVMRCLAGHKDIAFWWEDDKYKIEVRREFKHFDLSIWLLDDKEEKDEEERWIPVLVLENKVKTLPYKEQLKRYVDDAYELWKKGQIVKKVIENSNGESINDKCGITFILLSLILPDNFKEVEVTKTYKFGRKKTDKEYKISFSWSNNTYQALLDAFHANNYEPENRNFEEILKDYSSFVNSLLNIAINDWKISKDEEYLMRICPQDIKDEESNDETKLEKEKIKKLEELRIADIRQKICYEQLLDLLMCRLSKEKDYCVRRVESQDFGYNKKKKGELCNCFLCRTNFFHKKGLFEAIYLIRKKRSRDDEPFFLTIQIQGNLYMHGISGQNVVSETKVDKKNELGEFFNVDNSFKENEEKVGVFFDYNKKNPNLLKKDNLIFDDISFGKYGPNFIYQSAEIPPQMKISEILELMVDDIRSIKRLWLVK